LRRLPRSAALSLWRTQGERAAPPPADAATPPERASALLLTKQGLLWAWNYLKLVFTPRQRFRQYAAPASARPGIFSLPDRAVVGLAADWGTGTDSAYAVADAIRGHAPDVAIHLGDVYYSGTEDEFHEYFLGPGRWPTGKLQGGGQNARGAYTLNGNHEMYSGGAGYFRAALPALGQETSYFCLENAHWRLLGLDTGYYAKSVPFLELIVNFIKLHDAICGWLKDVVFANPADRRPVILLSHHQWFSAYDTEYERVGSQLRPYLDRVLLWFWGHEHRFAGYAPFGFDGATVRARCIGHGGMPIELGGKIKHADRPLVFSDDRKAQDLDGEGIGYCGFALLRLDGPDLAIEYRDEKNTLLLEERWHAGPDGARGSVRGGEQLTMHRPLETLTS